MDVPVDEPEFARFSRDGKVHVLRRQLADPVDNVPVADSDALVKFDMRWLRARQWALCGAKGNPGELFGLSAFPDHQLCNACYRAWPGDTVELFRHPQ